MQNLGNPIQAKFAEHDFCKLRRVAVGYDTLSKDPLARSSPWANISRMKEGRRSVRAFGGFHALQPGEALMAGQRGGERVVEQGGTLLSALHFLHDLVGAIEGVGARGPYLLH